MCACVRACVQMYVCVCVVVVVVVVVVVCVCDLSSGLFAELTILNRL